MTLTESQARALINTWNTNPLDVPDLEHDLHCVAGQIKYAHAFYTDSAFICPICKTKAELEKREADLQQRMTQAGIPARYLSLEWNDLVIFEALERIQQACSELNAIKLEGESLLLHGPPGSGKTQAAIMVAKTAIRSGFTARVINLGRLCIEVRRGYTDQHTSEASVLEELGSTDFLIFDDLGVGEARSGMLENRLLYLSLEERQNRRLPTIITSNLPPSELIEKLGSRVLNRLQPLTVLEVNHGHNFRFVDGRHRWLGSRSVN